MSDKELGFLVTPGEQQLSVRGVLLPPRALLQTPWQGSQEIQPVARPAEVWGLPLPLLFKRGLCIQFLNVVARDPAGVNPHLCSPRRPGCF